MTSDRDTFAAAALTGLIVAMRDESMSEICESAYGWADAMLRERDRTNHDAVPAAIARTDADRNRTDKAAIRPGKGAGNTPPMHATPSEGSLHGEGTSQPSADPLVL